MNNVTDYNLIVPHPNGGFGVVPCQAEDIDGGDVPKATKRTRRFTSVHDARDFAERTYARHGVRYSPEAKAEARKSFPQWKRSS